jgi:serine/threonine-protein phosphatase 2B catalytic subunit
MKINRFSEIPEQGTLCDLLWSDPLDENFDEWKSNKNRSCSYFFSRNHSIKFLGNNSLRMIIRGHEVQMKGYKYQTDSNGEPLALTVFSAPRYCDTYKNKGAVAIMNVQLSPIRGKA